MSTKAVDQILQRLIADAEFRQQFQRDRASAIGLFPMSYQEREAVAAIDVSSLVGAVARVRAIETDTQR